MHMQINIIPGKPSESRYGRTSASERGTGATAKTNLPRSKSHQHQSNVNPMKLARAEASCAGVTAPLPW